MMEKYKETKKLIADKEQAYTKEQQDLVELKNQVKEQQDLIAQKINDTNKSIQAYSDDIAKAEQLH